MPAPTSATRFAVPTSAVVVDLGFTDCFPSYQTCFTHNVFFLPTLFCLAPGKFHLIHRARGKRPVIMALENAAGGTDAAAEAGANANPDVAENILEKHVIAARPRVPEN